MNEYERGKKHAREYFGEFRSFKKDAQGRIIGYKHNGSTEVIGELSRHKAKTGFLGGNYEEMKRIIKSKPTRTVLKNKIKNKLFKSPTFRDLMSM
jgi:hypothetical protein